MAFESFDAVEELQVCFCEDGNDVCLVRENWGSSIGCEESKESALFFDGLFNGFVGMCKKVLKLGVFQFQFDEFDLMLQFVVLISLLSQAQLSASVYKRIILIDVHIPQLQSSHLKICFESSYAMRDSFVALLDLATSFLSNIFDVSEGVFASDFASLFQLGQSLLLFLKDRPHYPHFGFYFLNVNFNFFSLRLLLGFLLDLHVSLHFLEFLNLLFIVCNFEVDVAVHLLPGLEIGQKLINLKKGHEFIVLGAEAVELFLDGFEFLHEFKLQVCGRSRCGLHEEWRICQSTRMLYNKTDRIISMQSDPNSVLYHRRQPNINVFEAQLHVEKAQMVGHTIIRLKIGLIEDIQSQLQIWKSSVSF